jgi:hypothetical protein
LSRALQKYEQGDRDIPGVKLRTAFDDATGVRLGRTTAAWSKGSTQEIELIYEAGPDTEGSGGDTLQAHNQTMDVAEDRIVIVAQATNGAWYLVEAESGCEEGSGSGECGCVEIGGQDLTTLPGYDDTKTQIMGHESGCLKWLDTTECEEGS